MMTSTLDLSPIAEEQIRAAGETLGRAFSEDPLCVYTQPDLEARITQFTSLFTQLIREEARRHGACAAARMERVDAVAVWTPPTPKAPANEDAAASEIDQMQQRFGPMACHRFTTASGFLATGDSTPGNRPACGLLGKGVSAEADRHVATVLATRSRSAAISDGIDVGRIAQSAVTRGPVGPLPNEDSDEGEMEEP